GGGLRAGHARRVPARLAGGGVTAGERGRPELHLSREDPQGVAAGRTGDGRNPRADARAGAGVPVGTFVMAAWPRRRRTRPGTVLARLPILALLALAGLIGGCLPMPVATAAPTPTGSPEPTPSDSPTPTPSPIPAPCGGPAGRLVTWSVAQLAEQTVV